MRDDLHDEDQFAPSDMDIKKGPVGGVNADRAIVPPPDAPRPNFSHPVHGARSGVWAYTDTATTGPPITRRFTPRATWGSASSTTATRTRSLRTRSWSS